MQDIKEIVRGKYGEAAFLSGEGIDVDAIAPQVDGKFMSAFIRAVKSATACCRPECCA